MDVTETFYSMLGGTVSAPVRSISSEDYDESINLFLDMHKKPSLYDVQYEIEKIDEKFSNSKSVSKSNKDIKAFQECVVTVLYEELRRLLAEKQESELRKLQRESIMDKYFQPDIALLIPMRKKDGAIFANQDDATIPALEEEGIVLLDKYASIDADQVVEIRRKVQETSYLLSMLSSRAVEQSELAGSILQVADQSIGYVEKAESHLVRAKTLNNSFRLYMVMYFICLGIILWFLHFIK